MKLSEGERHLLTLAMATMQQPEMILLDKPFTGLSMQNISLIAQKLKALNKISGMTWLKISKLFLK